MIRPRRPEDVEPCLELLHEVHLADRYPVRWKRVGTTSLLLDDRRTTLPLVVFVLGD